MRAINRVRVRVHGTQIEYKRDETTSSIRRNHLNAAWERAIVIYDRDRVWVTKRREKGSGDANRLRSIPRFPDSWPRNERGGATIEGSGLPGQKSFLVLRLHDALVHADMQLLNCCGCETNGGIIVLLFLASESSGYARIYGSSVHSSSRIVLPVENSTTPFRRWSRRVSPRGREEANWPTGPGQWIAAVAPGRPPLFPFHPRSINFRKLID